MTLLNMMALPKLLQLCSTMLPVGAYSYSQGLEFAIEARLVRDATTAMEWIGDVLNSSQASFEVPVMTRMHEAWQLNDIEKALYWNTYFIASRETAELRAETLQMGYSMVRLLEQLDDIPQLQISALHQQEEVAFPCAFALAVSSWKISPLAAANAYLWSWLENQVSATLKAVPLGQVAGQRILSELGNRLPILAEKSLALNDNELSNFSPMLAIVSSQHETQYSRLFRS